MIIIKIVVEKINPKKTIKTINKATILTEKIKDVTSEKTNSVEYGADLIKNYSGKMAEQGKKAAVKGLSKSKDIAIKEAKHLKKPVGKVLNKIKTRINKVKDKIDTAKIIGERGKKLLQKSKEATKKIAHAIKRMVQITIKAVKSLVVIISTLGTVAFSIILILMLIGMLLGSVLGVFFSGEENEGSFTMPEVVNECNKEFYDRMETIQKNNPHDALKVEGTQAAWKDVLLIYASKEYKEDEEEVATIDARKRKLINNIFWEMNDFEYEVKTEEVEGSFVSVQEDMKPSMKKVLHIKIKSKTADEMIKFYSFNPTQMKNYNELSDGQFADLWSNIIYGSHETGDYVTWRQRGREWSNIRIGNTSKTIGDIGCLVTSIAIQIERSGVPTPINNFNPGTFVEALNKNGGFNEYGALQYGPINKVVPNFKYEGKINLRGLTREQKLNKITEYYNKGYYLTAEVLGATKTAQHWIAVTGVDDTGITMIDPGSEHTSMWTAYEWNLTSQFNYFKAIK